MDGNIGDEESSKARWALKAKGPCKRRYYLRP